MNGQLLTWVLLAEVLIVSLVILGLLIFLAGRKKKAAHKAIQTLTKKIKKNVTEHKEKVGKAGVLSSFSEKLRDELFEEVQQKESEMYQHVVKIFLKKEVDDLKKLDTYMDEISVPYWKALKEVVERSQLKAEDGADLTTIKAELELSLHEKERLSEQLASALKTLDEVSNEYANMFDGKKEQEELRISKDRMMDHFHQTLQERN